MAILTIKTVQTGLVGVLPSIAYINTTNTVAEVTATGFLNKEVANGASFSLPCLALVATKATPTSASVVGVYNVAHVGADWSLTLGSNDSINLASAQILVGNASGIATGVAMSGDATIDNAGAVTIADDAITTAKILDANVTLAKLAAGITPSHVIKFAGKENDGGGSATIAITVTGALATDVAFAQVEASTNAVSVQKVTPSADTVTVLLSGDPGAATVISYEVLRAAA